MPANHCLDPEDRDFFVLLAKIVFTNPFSVERSQIEQMVTPQTISSQSDKHVFGALIPQLDKRLQKLRQRDLDTIRPLHGEDRQLLETAFLFQAYHYAVEAMDSLIQREIKQSAAASEVGFATEVLHTMTRRGFSERAAIRYFGLFYQLRRAYYFIDQALLGDSPSMKALRLALWNSVFTYDVRVYDRYLWNRMEDFSTLLLGETGTGKGQAAAAIGRSGYIPFDPKQRRFQHGFSDAFIAINLSEFPESLLESELFGHRKGAFTGAIDDHSGVFERCKPHGSLFLDEIGDVSANVQIKLLRVLQERDFTPVGSRQSLRFAGRVIAATNRSLSGLRSQGRFRDDFFYRLCANVITVPSLRQRLTETPGELELLVRALLERMTGQDNPELIERVLQILQRDLPPDYPWPGNVRELEQAVRRILLTQHYQGDLPSSDNGGENPFLRRVRNGELDAKALLSEYCALLYERCHNFEQVARRTGLDRRTVRKYIRLRESSSLNEA